MKKQYIPKCNQCDSAVINGVYCHEIGCPNSKKTWVPDEQAWVLFLECPICGSDVREGEFCDCNEVQS